MPRVDYDQIASIYDEPGRDHPLDENLLKYLAVNQHQAQVYVLDVGCGTGKQLTANQILGSHIKLFGLDLFAGMLRIAKKRSPSIALTQADGTHIPFQSESFDFATNQFSYHHMPEKEKMFAEVYRVLKPGGRFVITNLDPWEMKNWFVYRFFPAAMDLDFQAFLPVEDLTESLRQIGFTSIQFTRSRKETRESLESVWNYAIERHRTSQLIAISDEDYLSGVRQIEQLLKNSRQPIEINSEITLVILQADKPDSQ